MLLEAVNVRSERPQGPMITPRTDMEGELLTNRCGDVRRSRTIAPKDTAISRRLFLATRPTFSSFFSRVPGADVPGAFAPKLGRGEVKHGKKSSHSPDIRCPNRAPFNFPMRENLGEMWAALADKLAGLGVVGHSPNG
jgi:hypothetical protein